MVFLLKMVIFYSYVKLPEGMAGDFIPTQEMGSWKIWGKSGVMTLDDRFVSLVFKAKPALPKKCFIKSGLTFNTSVSFFNTNFSTQEILIMGIYGDIVLIYCYCMRMYTIV